MTFSDIDDIDDTYRGGPNGCTWRIVGWGLTLNDMCVELLRSEMDETG